MNRPSESCRTEKLTIGASRIGAAIGVPVGDGPGDGGSLFLSLLDPLDTESRRRSSDGPEKGDESEGGELHFQGRAEAGSVVRGGKRERNTHTERERDSHWCELKNCERSIQLSQPMKYRPSGTRLFRFVSLYMPLLPP